MAPKLVAKPPEGEDWIHEIKLDGYRSQIVINSPRRYPRHHQNRGGLDE
ncbi:hypothetical protein [Mesorhizobium wenxiniae]|nr:hypothetical protein [Mesorhizobium wenxiniae]